MCWLRRQFANNLAFFFTWDDQVSLKSFNYLLRLHLENRVTFWSKFEIRSLLTRVTLKRGQKGIRSWHVPVNLEWTVRPDDDSFHMTEGVQYFNLVLSKLILELKGQTILHELFVESKFDFNLSCLWVYVVNLTCHLMSRNAGTYLKILVGCLLSAVFIMRRQFDCNFFTISFLVKHFYCIGLFVFLQVIDEVI